MAEERRVHPRTPVTANSVAVVYPNVVFSIDVLNISQGGIAFTYKGWEEWPQSELFLDFVSDSFYINKVPCTVVSDQAFDEAPAMRRCGVRFGEMNRNQRKTLTLFLEERFAMENSLRHRLPASLETAAIQ